MPPAAVISHPRFGSQGLEQIRWLITQIAAGVSKTLRTCCSKPQCVCATRLRNIPIFLKEAFERAVWKHNRLFAGGGKQEPISFHEYVHEPYPVGLGQPNYETIRAFITQDTELLALYDQ